MAFVHARSEGPIDFDSIFASLKQHCPGTELLDADYCASRISKLVEISRGLGKSEDNPVVLRALETARKLGQTRRIRVPLGDGGELVGTISQGGLLLTSKKPLAAETLAPVLAALGKFAQLQVKVELATVGLEPVPKQYESAYSENRYSPQVRKPWWKFWG